MPLKFLYDTIVTKILTKIVLVANAHAGPSNNARPAFEMTAIALPARYALGRSYYTHTMISMRLITSYAKTIGSRGHSHNRVFSLRK
jgi:hypothetical protein